MSNLVQVKTDGYFTKVYHNVKKLTATTAASYIDEKTGKTVQPKFTTDRKLILSNLIQKYENLFENKGYTNTHTRNDKPYHFYFQQSQLCEELNMTKKGMYKVMQFLKDEGYITYFSTNKEGYIYKATYVLINIDFLNMKLDEVINGKVVTIKENKEIMNQEPIIEKLYIVASAQHPNDNVSDVEQVNEEMSNIIDIPTEEFTYDIKGDTLLTTELPTVQFDNKAEDIPVEPVRTEPPFTAPAIEILVEKTEYDTSIVSEEEINLFKNNYDEYLLEKYLNTDVSDDEKDN